MDRRSSCWCQNEEISFARIFINPRWIEVTKLEELMFVQFPEN